MEVIVFLAFIGVCSAAINCYVCEFDNQHSYVGQSNCGDPFNEGNISTTPCGGECQKKVQHMTVKEGEDEHFQIFRTCANDNCEKSDSATIKCCSDDLCNAASPSAVYSFAFVLATSAVAYLV